MPFPKASVYSPRIGEWVVACCSSVDRREHAPGFPAAVQACLPAEARVLSPCCASLHDTYMCSAAMACAYAYVALPIRAPHTQSLRPASRTALAARAASGDTGASQRGSAGTVVGAGAATTRRAALLAGTVGCVWVASPARADFDFSLLPNVGSAGGPPKGACIPEADTSQPCLTCPTSVACWTNALPHPRRMA